MTYTLKALWTPCVIVKDQYPHLMFQHNVQKSVNFFTLSVIDAAREI